MVAYLKPEIIGLVDKCSMVSLPCPFLPLLCSIYLHVVHCLLLGSVIVAHLSKVAREGLGNTYTHRRVVKVNSEQITSIE